MKSYILVGSNGTIYHYKDYSYLSLHREDGPAVEAQHSKTWYKNGKIHREDGPAIEHISGSKEWYIEGFLHREDGPAIINDFGTKWWYIKGRLHREDGPAIEALCRRNYWYIHGEYINCSSQEEFEKLLKLKAFW